MTCYRNTILVALVVCCAAVARADDYLTYEGTIDVGRSLGRMVADPIRSKVYGITGDGDVVFIDRTTMSVENVIETGRVLRDVDIHPSNDYLTVLDNITGEYWNQPPKVYVIDYDLQTQSPSNIVFADAPLYQMAHGRDNRILGVRLNQWVSAYQLNATTGEQLSAIAAGFYDLYAKIGGTIPKVISPTLLDVVEVLGQTPESQFGEISITGYAKV